MPIARTLVVRLAVLLERGHPGSEHPLVRESVRSRSNRSARCKEGEAATSTISSVAEAEVAAERREVRRAIAARLRLGARAEVLPVLFFVRPRAIPIRLAVAEVVLVHPWAQDLALRGREELVLRHGAYKFPDRRVPVHADDGQGEGADGDGLELAPFFELAQLAGERELPSPD